MHSHLLTRLFSNEGVKLSVGLYDVVVTWQVQLRAFYRSEDSSLGCEKGSLEGVVGWVKSNLTFALRQSRQSSTDEGAPAKRKASKLFNLFLLEERFDVSFEHSDLFVRVVPGAPPHKPEHVSHVCVRPSPAHVIHIVSQDIWHNHQAAQFLAVVIANRLSSSTVKSEDVRNTDQSLVAWCARSHNVGFDFPYRLHRPLVLVLGGRRDRTP